MNYWKHFGAIGFVLGLLAGFFNGTKFLYGPAAENVIFLNILVGVIGGIIFGVCAIIFGLIVQYVLKIIDVGNPNLYPYKNDLARASRTLRIFTFGIAIVSATMGFLLAFTDYGNSMNPSLLSRIIASIFHPLWISGLVIPLLLFYPWVRFIRRRAAFNISSPQFARYCYYMTWTLIAVFLLFVGLDLNPSPGGGLWIPITVLLGAPWYVFCFSMILVFCFLATKTKSS